MDEFCPMCEGDEFVPLGRLGGRTHLRCRDCGHLFSVEETEAEFDLDLCPECLNLWVECECELDEPECAEGDYRD